MGPDPKPRIEFFLSNFIAGNIAGEVNLSKLFSEYKAFLRPRKSKGPRYATVRAELQDLERFGEVYRELIDRTADSALADFSRRLQPWDVTTVYPLVMRLWASDIDDHEKGSALGMLLSFIVRRGVCELTTKNYNKFFLTVIAHLDEQGWSASNLAAFLLAQKSETGRIPRDDEFERKWLNGRAYVTLQPARARAVLQEIEIVKRTKYHETTALAPALTVEHVMPQQWNAHWPMANGNKPTSEHMIAALYNPVEDDTPVGRIVRRNRLMQSFGNLTLLTQPLNTSMSNGPYKDWINDKGVPVKGKRTALQDHSLLVMNREITAQETWDEDAIAARGASLFALAKAIWKLPSASIAEG